jgi:hypothetical protein
VPFGNFSYCRGERENIQVLVLFRGFCRQYSCFGQNGKYDIIDTMNIVQEKIEVLRKKLLQLQDYL